MNLRVAFSACCLSSQEVHLPGNQSLDMCLLKRHTLNPIFFISQWALSSEIYPLILLPMGWIIIYAIDATVKLLSSGTVWEGGWMLICAKFPPLASHPPPPPIPSHHLPGSPAHVCRRQCWASQLFVQCVDSSHSCSSGILLRDVLARSN